MRPSSLLLALACLLPIAAYAEGDPQAGKTKAYTCLGCHGIEGYNNVYPTYKVPRVIGQNEPYLVAALQAYRDGQRSHPTMRAQAQSLSDQDMADISAWLSSGALQPADSTRAEPPEAAQVCQACHGPDGLGTDPSYPVLAGQHQNYLVKALQDYRSGARRNAIMGGFAGQLSDEDIDVLAAWYAGLEGLQGVSGR